jgi:hypothetical protein
MPTVSELIHSSFRLIGAIAAGETLETHELNDALVSLEQLIMSWNIEGASLVGRRPIVVNIASVNNYTLPLRPVKIEAASAAINGVENGIEIVDAAGWEAIPIPEKQMQSIFIRKLYCNYLYPTSTVYIWPVPRLPGTLEMWIYEPIPVLSDLTTVIDLPPGYEAGLRFALAVKLAPEYGRPLDATVVAMAQQFKASLVALNTSNHMRTLPPVATVPGQGNS